MVTAPMPRPPVPTLPNPFPPNTPLGPKHPREGERSC